MPVDVYVVMPYDFHLYLIKFLNTSYVIVEIDYLDNMPAIVKIIEKTFPVKAEGWKFLKKYQPTEQSNLLPLNQGAEDFTSDEITDRGYQDYTHTILHLDNMKYALLKVTLY